MFEQVAQKRMETMSETNVVHFLYIFVHFFVYVSLATPEAGHRHCEKEKSISAEQFKFQSTRPIAK